MYVHHVDGPTGSLSDASTPVRRQAPEQTTSASSNSNNVNPGIGTWGVVVMVLVGVVVALTATLFIYSYLRRLRLQQKVPRFLPGQYLKRRWMAWRPRGKYASLDVHDRSTTSASTEPIRRSVVVDRHTSVRSIISLPAYSSAPKETEEVIGREGERAGMDVVVEFPETVNEEEERREEEMESLYQIRQTRRREIAEREERRRERREAREAGDHARLEELRLESRQRRLNRENGSSVNLTAESLIAEHNARGRDRRVSSVSYAQVGQVRHDGSRVRAGSMESERALLSGAAPMADTSRPPLPHSRNGSEATSFLSAYESRPAYNRHRSDSGALSVSSAGSSFDDASRHETRPGTGAASISSHRAAHSITSHHSDEADLGEERIQPTLVKPGTSPMPPNYEAIEWGDAPAYEEQQRLARMNSAASQAQTGTSTSGSLARLPSLQVTPVISIQGPSQPNSPMVTRSEEGLGISGQR